MAQFWCNSSDMREEEEEEEGGWQSSEEGEKYYQCFCKKIYPSYSGVYLHLKYKHSDIFNKSQLNSLNHQFRKSGKIGSKNIYRLSDSSTINELDINHPKMQDSSGKKENNKNKTGRVDNQPCMGNKRRKEPLPQLEKRKSCPQLQRGYKLKQNINEDEQFCPFDCQMYKRPKKTNDLKIIEIVDADESNQIKQKSNLVTPKCHYSSLLYPYEYIGSNYNINTPSVEDFPFLSIGFKPCFRQVLEQCLGSMQSNSHQTVNSHRQILYDMMNYIDANYSKINDKRTDQRILLSYCSTFSGELLGPLIHQYALSSQYQNNKHLNSILNWLNVKGFAAPSNSV